MATIQERFDQAAIDVKQLKSEPADLEKLKLYSHFKQGSGADFNAAPSPGISGMFTKAGAKYNAWKRVSNLSVEEAQLKYIEIVEAFKKTYGFDESKKEEEGEAEEEPAKPDEA